MTAPFYEDGVYFGLPAETYHADPAIGSSNLVDLLADPADFWWHSALNPLRETFREETPAMAIGTAVHAFVLDGEERFARTYGRCRHPGNVKAGRDERDDLRFQGRIPLRGEDYDRIVLAGKMIQANPHIGGAFTGGQPEVSVFWTDDVDGASVRRKARFDYLRVRAVVDLKSHAPMDGVSFKASCLRSIKTFRRAIQIAAYLEARAALPRLVVEGRCFGADDVDPAWIKQVCDAAEFAFVLIFWASKGPPLTWGCTISRNNPLVALGSSDVVRALMRFAQYRAEFGTTAAWIRPEPLKELDPEEVDNWWRVDSAAG